MLVKYIIYIMFDFKTIQVQWILFYVNSNTHIYNASQNLGWTVQAYILGSWFNWNITHSVAISLVAKFHHVLRHGFMIQGVINDFYKMSLSQSESTILHERMMKLIILLFITVQLLEYKLQQEKIIQDDLRTSLEVERDRTSDLVSQLGREKNSNLDLQTDLSNQQLQVSKLKDALEREQSRFISVT